MQTDSAALMSEPVAFVADTTVRALPVPVTVPIRSDGEGYGRVALAAAMVGLGVLGLATGDFASVWQHVPIENMPGERTLAYLCAALELIAGIGLLSTQGARLARPMLVVILLLWVVLLKVPAVLFVPQMLATWLGVGEITIILAGAWVLYARAASGSASGFLQRLTGAGGIRCARLLFAVSLPTVGLSHFVYGEQTAALVPAWLPFPFGWAYLTGAGSLLACIGILSGTWPRLAATLEAVMLVVITVLVWMPGISPNPANQFQITGFLISSAIAAGAWVIADSYRNTAWLATNVDM